jgi:hypothetical protein
MSEELSSAEAHANELLRRGVWKAVVDRDGHRRTYYYNASTKERVWDLVSHVVKHKLHTVEKSSDAPASPVSGAGNLWLPHSQPESGVSSANVSIDSTPPTKSSSLAVVAPSGDAAKASPSTAALSDTSIVSSGPVKASVTNIIAGTQQLPPKLSSVTSTPLMPWQRRDALQVLAGLWKPQHQQQAVLMLSWLSLYRRGARSLLGSDTVVADRIRATSLHSWIVFASFPPLGNKRDAASSPPSTGCFQVVFEPNRTKPTSAASDGTIDEPCRVSFIPLEYQSAPRADHKQTTSEVTPDSVWTISVKCITFVEPTRDLTSSPSLSNGGDGGVCWALLSQVDPPSSRQLQRVTASSAFSLGAVITLLSPASLGVPWSVCSWASDGATGESALISSPRQFNTSSANKPLQEGSYLLPPRRPNLSSPTCSVVQYVTCSQAVRDAATHCVWSIRQKQSAVFRASLQCFTQKTTPKTPEVKKGQDLSGSCDVVKKKNVLVSLLDEALHVSPTLLGQSSPLPHHHASSVVPVHSIVNKRSANYTSSVPSLIATTTFGKRRSPTAGLPRGESTPLAREGDNLFNVIMAQLDSVEGIMAASTL